MGLEVDNTQFIKDVVNEYNSRDFIEQEKREIPPAGTDSKPGNSSGGGSE